MSTSQPQEHRLRVIEELEALLEEKTSCPLPKLWGTLYSRPNTDGSRKSCISCTFWVTSRRCVLHPPDLDVAGDAVCGYHVQGRPSKEWRDLPELIRLDPKLSGLERVPGGTSCDRCKFYRGDEEKGICGALVGDDGKPAAVQAIGCCGRWESGR